MRSITDILRCGGPQAPVQSDIQPIDADRMEWCTRPHRSALRRRHLPGRDQERIGHQARDVATSPLHDLAAPGSAIHMNREMSIEDDMNPFNRTILRGQDVAGIQVTELPMLGHPRDLLLGNSRHDLVAAQAIQKCRGHDMRYDGTGIGLSAVLGPETRPTRRESLTPGELSKDAAGVVRSPQNDTFRPAVTTASRRSTPEVESWRRGPNPKKENRRTTAA